MHCCFSAQAWVHHNVQLLPPAFALSLYASSSTITTTRTLQPEQEHEKRRYIPSLTNPGTTVAIVARTVPITNDWNVTVWEYETPAPIVEQYWSEQNNNQQQQEQESILLDPFGFITWPGALVAAQELLQHRTLLQNATVLVLGSGVGLEVQVAKQLGAKLIYALDINPTTLELLRQGLISSQYDDDAMSNTTVVPVVFDLCHPTDPLPFLQNTTIDLMIVADVLYNPQLAQHIARRCGEAFQQYDIPVLVTDSQRLVHNFIEMIQPYATKHNNSTSNQTVLAWQERKLQDFTGSGILVEQDQTYNVTARIVWMNPDKQSSL